MMTGNIFYIESMLNGYLQCPVQKQVKSLIRQKSVIQFLLMYILALEDCTRIRSYKINTNNINSGFSAITTVRHVMFES